ncbi:MAG: SAM-dependent methyltransferase, partial [Methylovulum sp.]
MKQSNLVSEQFSGSAQAYLTSTVHANGADLQRLTQLTRDSACRQALDLGCGAGHAAFAIAKAGSAVIAY